MFLPYLFAVIYAMFGLGVGMLCVITKKRRDVIIAGVMFALCIVNLGAGVRYENIAKYEVACCENDYEVLEYVATTSYANDMAGFADKIYEHNKRVMEIKTNKETLGILSPYYHIDINNLQYYRR